MKVDVIIPTCYPKQRFLELLDRLENQTFPVNRIIVMNTEKEGLNALISDENLQEGHPKVCLTHLSRAEFDHGRTRHEGVMKSDAEIFICMTQDALPADAHLVEALTEALQQDNVAVAYARQLPEADCSRMERFTRQFNYPENGFVKGQEDVCRLGIKTYFCSNVCAAYKREVYDRLGGFVSPTIFNEDMIWAARAVKAGCKIAYAAKANVIHSHNYTALQQLRRNFDLGVSHAQYPEIFADVPPEKEGAKLVKKTAVHLIKTAPLQIFSLVFQSAAKLVGYKLGKSYRKLPKKLVKRLSMQKSYWK